MLRRLRRAIRWHRRLVAAALATAATAFALSALAPAPPPTIDVVVAGRDLTGGLPLASGDLSVARLPPEAVPDGSADSSERLLGRVLAGPVRRGEPVTDVRLVGEGLVRGFGDDVVAAPVRLADADVVALLRPGDLVDVLATEARSGAEGAPLAAVEARPVARAVRVATIPRAGDDPVLGAGAAGDGALVVLATTAETATELARAEVTSRLSVVIRAGEPAPGG